jgi:hypothetical protein
VRRIAVLVAMGLSLAALLGGCGSSGALDVSGTYPMSLQVTGLATPVAHTLTVTAQGSGYYVVVAPADDTVPGSLTFTPGSSPRAGVAGSRYMLVMITSGSDSVGSYRQASGGALDAITSGTMDLTFGEDNSSNVVLQSASITLHSLGSPDYVASLAP